MRDVTRVKELPDEEQNISIHTSHAGCDTAVYTVMLWVVTFQSTHPMRDVTFLVRPADYRI